MTQDNTPPALTEEQLETIRERAEAQPLIVFEHISMEERPRVRAAFSDRWTLIHEVERLRDLLNSRRDAYLELRTEANTLLAERDKAEVENAAMRTREGELQTFASRLAFYAEAYAVHAEQAGYAGDANVARRVVSEFRAILAAESEGSTDAD